MHWGTRSLFGFLVSYIKLTLTQQNTRGCSVWGTHIFQVCAALTHNMAELWKVYRLMVFNYLIENKDDHAKNFAFIYSDGEWHFSPAYDILPSDGMNGYRTTSINDSIEPSKADLIAVATKAGLNKKDAEEIFKSIHATIRIHG